MKVINAAKKRVLSEGAGHAKSFFQRLRGLMLSRPRDLVIECPRAGIAESSIHMTFMRFSIDAVWVDEKMRVVDVQRNLPPNLPPNPLKFKIYRPPKPAKFVVELEAGKAGDTEAGDEVKFE